MRIGQQRTGAAGAGDATLVCDGVCGPQIAVRVFATVLETAFWKCARARDRRRPAGRQYACAETDDTT